MFYFNTVNLNSSGGGESPSVEEKKKHIVRVIDYDGKILKEEFLYEGQAFKMPDVPTHERMTFNYWEGDEPIIDGYVFAQDYPIIFGAIYTVNSGKSEFDITVPTDNYAFTLTMDGEKDWGDGTVDSLTSHTYATAGDYMIQCDGQNITGSISPIVEEIRFADLKTINWPNTSNGTFGEFNSVVPLKAVAFNDGVQNITSEASFTGFFTACIFIKGIVFPKTLTSDTVYMHSGISECYSIKTVVLSSNLKYFQDITACPSLDYIALPKSLIRMYSLRSCAILDDVHIPSGVNHIYASLVGCYSLKEITIPASVAGMSTNVLSENNSLSKIKIEKSNNIITLPSGFCSLCPALTEAEIPENITSASSSGASFVGSALSSLKTLSDETLNNMYALKEYKCPSQSSFSATNCYALKKLEIDDNVSTVSLTQCRALRALSVPQKVTSFTMNNCNYMEELDFSECTNSLSLTFENDGGLYKLVGSPKTSSLRLYNCVRARILDFDKSESIITLSGSNPLYGLRESAVIYVPFGLYNDWINATGWTTYKKRIKVKHPAHITFDIDSNDYTLYVNGVEQQNNQIEYAGYELEYICEDNVSGAMAFGEITGIDEGEQVTETISFSSCTKRVALDVGVSGLSVSFTINGVSTLCTEENGVYYTEIVANHCEVFYSINGGNNYMDESGTIAFTGEDVTVSVTLTPAVTEEWIRPDLTEDGTMGGDSFAVSAEYNGTNAPWKAVDSDKTTTIWSSKYISSTTQTAEYTLYNPTALVITNISLLFYDSSNKATAVSIFGSNDNQNWNELESNASTTSIRYTLAVSNRKPYKYYKLAMNGKRYCYIWVRDLEITGYMKVPATQE